MPKRKDISSILLIGSGPIVIGQACEFDYSGTQAVKALQEEGYKVILVNSNPATIMTDPEFADRTYIEPITAEVIERVLRVEKPDAVLPTMGGQTALNVALELYERGVFEELGIELIGANIDAIETAEDRELFRKAMDEIGLQSAPSELVTNITQAKEAAEKVGYPIILRPSRTLGGTGGGIVTDPNDLEERVKYALSQSPNSEVLLEKSLVGWKEIELEVMRDLKDNVVIICGIENIDPMGVHTGDSMTVAPLQTVTDKEYQLLRDAAIRIMRRIGVDTGGSNVQFAMNPETAEIIVIEMNPRVSRSSALASKATGFPIARIAAKLAVGLTLDEIPNDITEKTLACFEPSIDYVVVKIPRFNFEKFPLAEKTLGTQMKSVGEVLSFGRSFKEAFQKALSSLEQSRSDLAFQFEGVTISEEELSSELDRLSPDRMWFVAEALRRGISLESVYQKTGIDRWFLHEIGEILAEESEISSYDFSEIDRETFLEWKQAGFSDARLAQLLPSVSESEVRKRRLEFGVRPVYKSVDTCGGEFVARTPYLYSSYDLESDLLPEDSQTGGTVQKRVIVLGSGPNRIGQGIEFDYCCVHAVSALRDQGIEAIMVNCNPETVSTDYDMSDRLYFEPLTLESVLEIVDRENPLGVIVQFGGQTPLKLARDLAAEGVRILGTSVEDIELAEDRERFSAIVDELQLTQPENATARSEEEALRAAERLGYPLMLRPSFVLGGRAMRVVYDETELRSYVRESVLVSDNRPLLLDRYLHNAIEVDVDLVSDGKNMILSGILEHIERAGIHSGDSSCCLPPLSLSKAVLGKIEQGSKRLAERLNVVGLMNVQFAVTKDESVYFLEANPRASRTVPFVSKATGIPWAKVALEAMLGGALTESSYAKGFERETSHQKLVCVKACVFPFSKFRGVDTILGPEMKSTGEVMGTGRRFPIAFAKAMMGAGVNLPIRGTVFLSVMDRDKDELIGVAKRLRDLGFDLIATAGTAKFLDSKGISVTTVNKVREGTPHIVDLIGAGRVDLVINTPEGSEPLLDSRSIRLAANEFRVPTLTTMAAARAASEAISILLQDEHLEVLALQDLHGGVSMAEEVNYSSSANE